MRPIDADTLKEDFINHIEFSVDEKGDAYMVVDACLAIDSAPTLNVTNAAFKGFAEWVADWILRSDFQESAGGFAELACRRLKDLGIMRKDGHYWVMNEVEE